MLKLVVVLAIVIALLWMARGGRRRVTKRDEPSPNSPPATPPAAPEAIIACSYCGLHLPRGEALPGRGGQFCSEAHRAAFEQAQP